MPFWLWVIAIYCAVSIVLWRLIFGGKWRSVLNRVVILFAVCFVVAMGFSIWDYFRPAYHNYGGTPIFENIPIYLNPEGIIDIIEFEELELYP